MKKLKEKFLHMLENRNGVDDLGLLLTGVAVLLVVLSFLLDGIVLMLAGIGFLLYAYYRIFSGNLDARREENRWYLSVREHARFKRQSRKLHRTIRRTDKYVHCRKCKKQIRLPHGWKREELVCPHCGYCEAEEKETAAKP